MSEKNESLKEVFAMPAAAAIIVGKEKGEKYIVIQRRMKEGGGIYNGMIEIPAGKIREYESVFDALRREVREETGLEVIEIEGEAQATKEINGYTILELNPFFTSQNLAGGYSIILLTFICRAEGELLEKTNESEGMRKVSFSELAELIEGGNFLPMHISALKKYIAQET